MAGPQRAVLGLDLGAGRCGVSLPQTAWPLGEGAQGTWPEGLTVFPTGPQFPQGTGSGWGGEGRGSWARARPCEILQCVDKPRGVQSRRVWSPAVMRLLIQQASWCCRPEPRAAAKPQGGS